MDLWFVPTDSMGHGVGTPFDWPIGTDLVGPPPPLLAPIASTDVGDGFVTANWTPNTDSDTAAYDVFVDPPPGVAVGTDAAPASSDAAAQMVLVCPEAGSPEDAGAADDATADDASAAADGSASGCFFQVLVPPTSPSSSCPSNNLTRAVVLDGGTADAAVTDDAGDAGASAATTGAGGLATIDCQFLAGASCPAGGSVFTAISASVSGESSRSFRVTGLTNSAVYSVAVSAVDAFGNPGPPSAQQCGSPQPVADFFGAYRGGGGNAGGLCALEAVGMAQGSPVVLAGFGAALAAIARRRRRKPRDGRGARA
jgi:hypothetical protein